jgi:predicted metalloprotease with PDZ domain
MLGWSMVLLLGVPFGRAAATDSPVVLPAFGVTVSVLNLPVRIEYERTPFGLIVHKVYVGLVKTPSIAHSAGLKEDMEIVAIQGQKVSNLSQARFDTLLSQPTKDAVVLLVRRSWLGRLVEVRLPVPRDPAATD